jgi:hypothetical protein
MKNTKKINMKNNLLYLFFCASSFITNAQIEDSIAMGVGYTNESYYSLTNGEQVNIDNTNWDIAFDLSGFGSSVRINEHTGTKVYAYPNGSKADWATVDTAGLSTWTNLNNSDKTWKIGAFDRTANPANFTDLGWANYNTTTHQIIGDSIHIIELSNGDFKKLMLESLISGVYSFKYADLNGSNEVSATVTKANYTDKKFAYYSLQTGTALDREPAKDDWDIVFTKYTGELSPGVYYGVTGVLSNDDVQVREASGINPNTAVWSNYTVDSIISVIGYDWKSFNMSTFSYDVESDLSYFIEDKAGALWQLVLTRFDGSATGKVVFTKELISNLGLEAQDAIHSFGVHPNPASDVVSVLYNTSSKDAQVILRDMSGKIVYQESLYGTGFSEHKVDVHNLPKGYYLVSLVTKDGMRNTKLILQ